MSLALRNYKSDTALKNQYRIFAVDITTHEANFRIF